MPNSEIMEHLVRITPSIASLSPSQDTTTDQLTSFYRPSAIPFVRHSPLPVAAQSAAGAAGRSVSQTTSIRSLLGVVRNQAQIAPSTLNQGLISALPASSTTNINNLVFLCGTTAVVNTGADGSVANAANAVDGNLSTFAQCLIGTSGSAGASAQLTLSGVPSISSSGGLILFIKSAVPTNHISSGVDCAKLIYTFDGSSFTTIYTLGPTTTRPVTIDSIPIPNSMNLALIQVRASVQRSSGIAQACELDLYEAYIGTL